MDGKKAMAARPFPDAVRPVSTWALLNACVFAFAFAYALVCALVDHFQSSDQLTDTEEGVEYVLEIGMALALQAAAAVLALRLPCRRRWARRSLAYLALALTIVPHCVYAHEGLVFLVTHPGDIFFRISFAGYIFVFAVGDIVSAVALLLGGEELE